MIRSWTVKHFKSINSKTPLEFAPLTIFAGANSSGKSTVIQSILLTAQTLQNPVSSRSVILNGRIVRLGTFNDLVSVGHSSENIQIGFSLGISRDLDGRTHSWSSRTPGFAYTTDINWAERLDSVDCTFSFSGKSEKVETADVSQLQPALTSSEIAVNLKNTEGRKQIMVRRSDQSVNSKLDHLNIIKFLMGKQGNALEFDVYKWTNDRRANWYQPLPKTAKAVGASMDHFLTRSIAVCFNSIEQQAEVFADVLVHFQHLRGSYPFAVELDSQKILLPSVRDKIRSVLLDLPDEEDFPSHQKARLTKARKALQTDFTLDDLFHAHDSIPSKVRRVVGARLAEIAGQIKDLILLGNHPENALTFVGLPGDLDFGAQYVSTFFQNYVKYLGPLRDEPKPVYPLAGGLDPSDVGYKGEHTAAVLDVFKNTVVDSIDSNSFEIGNSTINRRRTPLLQAVLNWLEFMGVVTSIKSQDMGKLGHELRVATTDKTLLHDLTHVGVGVSQVLPILVLSLLAPKGSTLIFEQPELHLHPRVQARLADFFVSLTMLGKQCIVETHSQNLITRLRYQAAIREDDSISKDVMIYFVEKEYRESKYRKIRINEFGAIPDWPRGFFDENEDMAAGILRASILKKRAK